MISLILFYQVLYFFIITHSAKIVCLAFASNGLMAFVSNSKD